MNQLNHTKARRISGGKVAQTFSLLLEVTATPPYSNASNVKTNQRAVQIKIPLILRKMTNPLHTSKVIKLFVLFLGSNEASHQSGILHQNITMKVLSKVVMFKQLNSF